MKNLSLTFKNKGDGLSSAALSANRMLKSPKQRKKVTPPPRLPHFHSKKLYVVDP